MARSFLQKVVWLAGLAMFAYAAPFVRIVPLDLPSQAIPTKAGSGEFDAATAAREFWTGPLQSGSEDATDARRLLDALARDPSAAGERFGRHVGVSRGFFVALRGEGEVIGATDHGTTIRLAGDSGGSGSPELLLPRGPLFGSALRDATGLLSPEAAPSTKEYNSLAVELNRICEAEVLPAALGFPVGSRVRFFACAKVSDPKRFALPLEVIPVWVEPQ